ncbi:MAG: hypothetical protein Fur0018_10150 [Anaerolineales bacterium]
MTAKKSPLPPCSVVIQAGGASRRMRRDKGLLPFRGRPLTGWILEQVQGFGAETLIISNTPDSYQKFGLPVYPDVLPRYGALGGLYSALHHARHDFVVVLACDMPFVNLPLLQHLCSLAPGHDIVAPRLNARTPAEPFRAVYRRDLLPALRYALDAGELRIGAFLEMVDTHYVPEADLRRFDPDLRSFRNINTPADLEAALRESAGE